MAVAEYVTGPVKPAARVKMMFVLVCHPCGTIVIVEVIETVKDGGGVGVTPGVGEAVGLGATVGLGLAVGAAVGLGLGEGGRVGDGEAVGRGEAVGLGVGGLGLEVGDGRGVSVGEGLAVGLEPVTVKRTVRIRSGRPALE